jgi:hypothetical protein
MSFYTFWTSWLSCLDGCSTYPLRPLAIARAFTVKRSVQAV